MMLLTNEENESYIKQEVCHICKKEKKIDLKITIKRDHCHYTGKYRGAAHNACNLNHKASKEIPIVFHNDSTYDYLFINKELAKEFNAQFECLGKNSEKYITFSVPFKKHKLKFIGSFRFMSTSLSSLVNSLSDELYNAKFIDCKSYLDYMLIKDDQLIFRCFEGKQNYKKYFNRDINRDTNKFILLLRKGVYPYEYLGNW